MAARLISAGERRPHGAIALERRGVHHGYAVPEPGARTPDPAAAWRAAEPIVLPGLLRAGVNAHARAIASSLAMFDRLRDDARWLDECDARLRADAPWLYSGSTVDHIDQREIERLFVDALGPDGKRRIARDITARLSWIADDEADDSLRIRFSFGHDSLQEWLVEGDARAELADRFAADVFPECAVLDDPKVRDLLASLHGRPVRLSERIVYSNAPHGGAVFHCDADPGQRGVLFGQLAGRTAWLALPKLALAGEVAAHDARFASPADAARALGSDDRELWELLNTTPAFTERLAERGSLHVLDPGDAIVMSAHGDDRVTWHSVFALGNRPSLAHSYGIFDAPVAPAP